MIKPFERLCDGGFRRMTADAIRLVLVDLREHAYALDRLLASGVVVPSLHGARLLLKVSEMESDLGTLLDVTRQLVGEGRERKAGADVG